MEKIVGSTGNHVGTDVYVGTIYNSVLLYRRYLGPVTRLMTSLV